MNLVKLSIVALTITSIFAIKYIFADYLPERSKAEQQLIQSQQQFENSKICSEVGKKFYQNIETQSKNTTGSLDKYFEPEYIYNSKLNTCLYLGHSVRDDEKEGLIMSDFIMDLYSNKHFISWTRTLKDGKVNQVVGSQEQFDNRKIELGFVSDWY